jgi:hypothetical protein
MQRVLVVHAVAKQRLLSENPATREIPLRSTDVGMKRKGVIGMIKTPQIGH